MITQATEILDRQAEAFGLQQFSQHLIANLNMSRAVKVIKGEASLDKFLDHARSAAEKGQTNRRTGCYAIDDQAALREFFGESGDDAVAIVPAPPPAAAPVPLVDLDELF
ncbi:MAG: hypothetical protein LBQ80_01960 [Clostridium sp.]|jgi:hypothetical protein|nr:hypothetical protein [Clostridium sp.]